MTNSVSLLLKTSTLLDKSRKLYASDKLIRTVEAAQSSKQLHRKFGWRSVDFSERRLLFFLLMALRGLRGPHTGPSAQGVDTGLILTCSSSSSVSIISVVSRAVKRSGQKRVFCNLCCHLVLTQRCSFCQR